ncbi:MAG: C45 family peptidase [Armatimonadota bacterium]
MLYHPDIIPVIPFDDGQADGLALGREGIRERTAALLDGACLKDTLGAMNRADLGCYVMARLETPPNYARYPELEEIYPEKIDYLRGLAKGAGCSLKEAAVYSYVTFREEIDRYYLMYQLDRGPAHCSGFVMAGPDGVIGGQNIDSAPSPKPEGYRPLRARPYAGLRQSRTHTPSPVLRKPRTGYIEEYGIGNEMGVAYLGGGSCGVWLDEPIEDTWPIGRVPLLRFAANVEQLADLYRRYTLHNWGRDTALFADTRGGAIAVEKSYRRIGIRVKRPDEPAIWATEGHWETPEMGDYLRARRHEYIQKVGTHLGAGDLQYAADNAVRFTHLGVLCHEPWGNGYEHVRRILTDHSPFPRNICRHAGPDTDAYDVTVTLKSYFQDITHNRAFIREWTPWKRFCCQAPEAVVEHLPRP